MSIWGYLGIVLFIAACSQRGGYFGAAIAIFMLLAFL